MNVLLKEHILRNRRKRSVIGMRSWTREELVDFKQWLSTNYIKHEHRTTLKNGDKLPFNGILIINPKGNKYERR